MRRAFENAGYRTGGFCAYTTSNVLKGSGISSSAAFEVMVGNILNHLFNDGKVWVGDFHVLVRHSSYELSIQADSRLRENDEKRTTLSLLIIKDPDPSTTCYALRSG